MMRAAEGEGKRYFPAVVTDGRIDILTGLDAPEIFYKFLERAIAQSSRNQEQITALLRFRLTFDEVTQSVDFEVAALSDFLKKRTRADENLVRIGEVTFLLLARVANEDELEKMIERFSQAIPDFQARYSGKRKSVDSDQVSTKFASQVEISAFCYKNGESMLDFLERAGV
jgi:GGDEF domain-containing protein